MTLNEELLSTELGSHSRLSSLTRQANRISGRRYSQCPWKQGNHTINYGEGDYSLAAKLGCSVDEARARKRKYFGQFPNIEVFVNQTHEMLRAGLVTHTLLGRKRRLMDANADWQEGYWSQKERRHVPERAGKLAARACRQGPNFRIQGLAAEVAKLAQILTFEDAEISDTGAKQLLQIHDEILFEVPDETLEPFCARAKAVMEKPFIDIPERLGLDFRELSIPLDVDVGTGVAWSEAH